MSDDNPTLEEITSERLNMPLDSVPDLVAYAKKRFALAAVNHRIRASRQSDIGAVKRFDGQAHGLAEASDILDDVFTRFNIDPDDDEDLPDEGTDILDEMTGGEEVEETGKRR